MIGGFLAGAGAAIGGTFALSRALRRKQRAAIEAVGRDPACEVTILLFAPDGTASSRLIDRTTGQLGFSHVALMGCEVDAHGQPLLIDCRPGHGVHRRPLAFYDGRQRAEVVLAGPAAGEMYGCARAHVGADFTPENSPAGALCSQLVASCLPRDLAARVTAQSRYSGPAGWVSPNQIAAAFGARLGASTVVW